MFSTGKPWFDLLEFQAGVWLVVLGLVLCLAVAARRLYNRTKRRWVASLLALIGALLGGAVGLRAGADLPLWRIHVEEVSFSTAAYGLAALLMMVGAWAGLHAELRLERRDDGDRPVEAARNTAE